MVIAAAFAPHTLSASDWRVWVAALVLADLAYYAEHRMDHRIRLLWAGHSVHHSSQHFNLSTAVRLPWLIPGSFLASVTDVPLALLGIPAWMIFLAHSIVLLFQYPIHTERVDRLPRPIEFVFNTPSHHRVHHGANNPYLDKNYGGILIVWDRMFGSYAEETEPVRYGLTTNIGTHNPVRANYHEFAGMVRIRKVWADGDCRMHFVEHAATLNTDLEITQCAPGTRGFTTIPKRWTVERPYDRSCSPVAWLAADRRPPRFAAMIHLAIATIHLAMTHLMAHRLTGENTSSWRDPTRPYQPQVPG